VKPRNLGRDITQSICDVTGGELKACSEPLSGARDESLERTVEGAESLGADAVVTVRMESSAIANGTAGTLG
jgi:uncharacterized protein YbjQ (UPF0145 family)